jgi:hypothetical protein
MSEPPPAACANCGAPLRGRFCHDCGQRVRSLHVRLREVLRESLEEAFDLDGRIAHTVRLLVTRPGLLTRELLAGRRARYVSPLRLYLTFSVLFFALAAVVPGARQGYVRAEATDSTSGAGPTAADLAAAERLGDAILANMPRAAFLLMPVFGLLTWAFYRRQERYYVPHLYHSLHFHAFAFLVLALSVPLELLGKAGRDAGGLLVLATVPYHYLSLRRVFGGSRWATALKGSAIGTLYLALVAVVMMAMVMTLIRLESVGAGAAVGPGVTPAAAATPSPSPPATPTPAPPP